MTISYCVNIEKNNIQTTMANIIEGSPTKQFFIDMITRDISIEDAIIDLLDNSIDGANRLATAASKNDFKGLNLHVILSLSEAGLSIEDNCGGFSLETAKKYAFRFGRPSDAPQENNTIGRFGIGMKRALFKMGRNFTVESKCGADHYRITVDVAAWSMKMRDVDGTPVDDWSFDFVNITDGSGLQNDGTKIEVTNLYDGVLNQFRDGVFKSSLKEDIKKLLNFSIIKGISISMNGVEIEGSDIEMIVSDSIKPYVKNGEKDGVKFRIIAGLSGVGSTKKSGWYIYCNDRLVLEADQSSLTGWGYNGVPQWHVNYVMFVGVVFFDAEETIKLPLTTTKKGVDASHPVYLAALYYMRSAMKLIFPYLRKIGQLGSEANAYRIELFQQEKKEKVDQLKLLNFDGVEEERFEAARIENETIAKSKDVRHISYDVPRKIADKARLHAEVDSYKELGQTTFDYYVRQEDIK